MSFTLGGVTAATLGIIVEEGLDIPLLPAIRERTVEIPGRAGVYYYGADLGPRTFYIPCVLNTTTSEAELEAAIRTISNLLTDNYGRPATLVLEFDAETGKYYDVRYSGSISVDRILNHTKGTFTLQLTADNPFAYGSEQTETDSFTASPDSISVSSSGNVASYPEITLTNNGSDMTDGFTLDTFEYIGTLLAGEVLVIDSDSCTVEKDGENDIANMDGDFPELLPGTNVLTYTDSESSRTIGISVVYREKWV